MRKNIGGNVTKRALAQRCKQLFCNRISHVVTINAHLFYPVYCLRFDRTGRFFVTGSDDNIVKLFKLGSVGCDIKAKRGIGSIEDNFSDQRGAVLICTLRGHASVITDIDVSSDNSLLATASEDGDVRIWGMTNGCPVAILRGHEGGANMVSWSSMTPYRLVTIGQDGFARLWDIRDAALKRCTTIRNRSEYMVSSSRNNDNIETLIDASDDVVLPPIHPPNAPNEQLLAHDVPRTEHNNNRTGIYVPPLPPGAEMGIGAENISLANGENVPAPGEFVANNEIDEGVQLLTQFQHGDAPSEDQYQGTGTRSRRKKIKVICLSRCPAGGHFATGSDDGIGRIWLDEDDESIAKLDDSIVQDMTNLLPDRFRDVRGRRRSARTNDSFNATCSALLASLHGHHNDITDIKYSSIGDRLLTASQKDGVVRIWSWGSESPKGSADGSIKIDQIRQIFLRLEPPPNINTAVSSSADNSGPVARRRASASSLQQSLHVFCDLATWSSDDSKVITSQTCVTKLTDTEIVPGSQVLYVWDSLTGSCLLGIPSAHVKACTVVAPHPLDASIIMSAGLDGFIKIWDLEYGKCEFSFLNTHEYGCLENLSDKGKTCGYLDGTFSPDGMNLVLTDDTGRITVLDALGNSRKSKDSSEQDSNTISNEERAPLWMQEQYFANDYYELFL
jgi:WD40 repeat protein